MNPNTRDAFVKLLFDLQELMDELRTPAGAEPHTCAQVRLDAAALMRQLKSDETII